MKKCNKCNKRKSKERFHKATKNKDGLYHTCKDCRKSIDSDYYRFSNKKKIGIKNRKKEISDYINNIKSSGCCICGEDNIVCLDFHHLNPNEKDFTIAQFSLFGFDKVKNEIKKCVIVCANCHRKIHAGIVKITEDITAGTVS